LKAFDERLYTRIDEILEHINRIEPDIIPFLETDFKYVCKKHRTLPGALADQQL
jgi:hypothetical protein